MYEGHKLGQKYVLQSVQGDHIIKDKSMSMMENPSPYFIHLQKLKANLDLERLSFR